jgi:tRNA threonylcarbamoyladenosine biosynthesis protein TsaB
VTTGPGGITGGRIGLATARGGALSRGLPVIGITTYQGAAAAAAPAQRAARRVVAAIDSKRAAVFLQVFDSDLVEVGPPAEVLAAELPAALPAGPLVLTGDAAVQVAQALAEAGRADVVVAAAAGPADAARLAARAALRDPAVVGPAEPVYLRPPDVTPPKVRAPRR